MKTTVNNNNIESKKATREAASKNNRKALCDELCTLLGYKAWEIKKDACTGKFAGSYDYSMKFEDGKELYICTRKDLFETNVSELIDGFKRTSKEGYKHGDMVKTKNSGRLAKVMRVGTVCEGYGTMLYLKEEGVAPKDNRFVEIHNLICSAVEVEPLQPASEITEAEGVKIGDKVKHVWSDEVATVTAIRKAYWDASAGEVWLFTLDYGKDTKGDWKTVLGPFKMDLNGKEFRREAFTLYEPSEITEQREQNDACISSAESRRDKANGQIKAAAIVREQQDRPGHVNTSWATDYTPDDFQKLRSRYEIADEDRDIVGRRFHTGEGLWTIDVFVSDYAGNEAHALIYILTGEGEVRANVLSLDHLRATLTEAKGWHEVAA